MLLNVASLAFTLQAHRVFSSNRPQLAACIQNEDEYDLNVLLLAIDSLQRLTPGGTPEVVAASKLGNIAYQINVMCCGSYRALWQQPSFATI